MDLFYFLQEAITVKQKNAHILYIPSFLEQIYNLLPKHKLPPVLWDAKTGSIFR